jgi:hypothetical protein
LFIARFASTYILAFSDCTKMTTHGDQTLEHRPVTASPVDPSDQGIGPDRRAILVGLAALIASPTRVFATPDGPWTLATQIVTGTRVVDPTMLGLAVAAVESSFGTATVDKLLDAVLARDAANIVEPFADPEVEAAARRFVEIVYTGEIAVGSALGFHQALAWQVLSFAKPPSICGPGFGWWTNPPDDR